MIGTWCDDDHDGDDGDDDDDDDDSGGGQEITQISQQDLLHPCSRS